MTEHRPVMLAEALAYLGAAGGGLYIDATLGLGGHTEAILQASPLARVIGLDRDGEAIEKAGERLAGYGERFEAIHTDYRRIKQALIEREVGAVVGVLADLGVSSLQLDLPGRGFSFRQSGPLDMRMDRRGGGATAADLINELGERELSDLIHEYGEERAARRIARRVIEERRRARIETTEELAQIVVRAAAPRGRWRIHPATRTFQALRIAVNRELDGLAEFISDAVDLLAPGGRLVMITFHSLEDRIVKRAFRFQAGHCVCPPAQPRCSCGAAPRVELLTRKAVLPTATETADNPRARSAKLRACRRLGA